jgi:selenium donor protein
VLVGLDARDDAAVYKISEEVAIVQTVDFFTPIVDDPHAWGRIAAANSFSDVYAMGARPALALNLICWPRELGFELLGRVLRGAGEACDQAGVTMVGGHSVDDPEPKFGMAVTGMVHPAEVITKAGAPPGCELVLTKPLGTGIISSGIKDGVAEEGDRDHAVRVMSRLNRAASEAMIGVGVAAATDVTGFGLVGHLRQMLSPETSAELDLESIPILPGAVELARRGVIPGGSKRNLEADLPVTDISEIDEGRRWLLFDAQTSGGLLIAVAPERSSELLSRLKAKGVEDAAVIGRLVPGEGRVKVDA